MTFATLSAAQIATLKLARQLPGDDRKAIKKEIFANAKAKFGIPADVKVKAEIDDTFNADYGVLKTSNLGVKFELASDGKWVSAQRIGAAPAAPAPKRWFMVSRTEAIAAMVERLISDGTEFDDGDAEDGLPYTGTTTVTDGIKVDDGGDFWIALTEDQLI